MTQTSGSSSSAQASPSEPLRLTIRFSNSHPDTNIDVSSPTTTSVLCLKHDLRSQIASRSRLRLIYHGRLLPDTAALSTIFFKAIPPAPPSPPAGKGKAKADPPPTQRIYVNCSMGDELSTEELEEEAKASALPPEQVDKGKDGKPAQSTRPRPKGFDRLLNAGFSTSDIATLRTQFMSIHHARFTPDAPPSPDTLHAMEDAWIDTNATDIPSANGGAGGAAGEQDGGGMGAVLDIMIKGIVIGFFFPMGCLGWLLRERGLWSDRWKIFVVGGVICSLAAGAVVQLSGGGV